MTAYDVPKYFGDIIDLAMDQIGSFVFSSGSVPLVDRRAVYDKVVTLFEEFCSKIRNLAARVPAGTVNFDDETDPNYEILHWNCFEGWYERRDSGPQRLRKIVFNPELLP